VSWIREHDRFQLFFNRDESRRRGPARPPELRRGDARNWAAPTDGDFGGSWIGVNDHGLAICLLNGYADDAMPLPAAGDFTSRGLLLTSLIDALTVSEVQRRLAARDLSHFRSFWVAAFEPSGPATLARWDGDRLIVEPLEDSAMPLVSSSFATGEVRRSRTELLRRMKRESDTDATETHLAYHESHDPVAGPYSPCMHRSDAESVSFSWIRVGTSRIEFFYSDDSPHAGRPLEPSVVMERR